MFQIYSHSNDQLGEGQGGQFAEGGVPWDQGGRGQQQQEGPWHQLQSMYITQTHIYSFFLTMSIVHVPWGNLYISEFGSASLKFSPFFWYG